jgi:Holliday junction DNA helicase RuvA
MIGRLTGTLAEKNAPWVLIDVQGVGYEVQMPMSSFFNLPNLGDKLSVLTQLVVREDAHLLFGFLSHEEREAFRELVKVSGVGARTALAVLSGLSVQDLRQAIALQETGRLTRVPGIGKKTAERLLLELKGKLADALPGSSSGSPTPDAQTEVVFALCALGYSEKEAVPAAKALPAGISVTDGLKMALKSLMR